MQTKLLTNKNNITSKSRTKRVYTWALLLQEFDITYVLQKPVKGQAFADFLANHPIPDDWEFSKDLSDEDVLFIEVPRP